MGEQSAGRGRVFSSRKKKEKPGNTQQQSLFHYILAGGTALPEEHFLAANDQAINISGTEGLCANWPIMSIVANFS